MSQQTAPDGAVIETTYVPEWRAEDWPDEMPSRHAWLVRCSEHGQLSDGWGHPRVGTARSSATRHLRRYHWSTANCDKRLTGESANPRGTTNL